MDLSWFKSMNFKRNGVPDWCTGKDWSTSWGQMLLDPTISDPGSRTGKRFRRRFRVPYPLFQNVILPECRRVNIFDTKYVNMVRIPIEFKILICLRILGRGNCADDIAEMASSFESTVSSVFHEFVCKFVKHFYDGHVKVPDGERLIKNNALY